MTTMCHRTQIPTFLDAEPTHARPPDPRGPATVVLCPSFLGIYEVTGQFQATLEKSPMQLIDRSTFVFNHPSSSPPSCFFFKLQAVELRQCWSRFSCWSRLAFCCPILAGSCHGAPAHSSVYPLNHHRDCDSTPQASLHIDCTGVHR